MQLCAACGARNEASSRFCSDCGGALVLACPECGEALPSPARFCPSCGAPVGESRRSGTERKVVTVLFADLVDSTGLGERADPEDVAETLGPLFETVRAELERHGGTVEKYIGDAVMALFGAPIAHEDDPERAVRCALAIRDTVAGRGAGSRLRIGVNTGEALVALGARPGAGQGMATGDVVNTCFRLQEAAEANAVLVGEVTYRATCGAIEYEPHAPIRAKGKVEPVAAWAAVSARTALPADDFRPPRTALVGRRRELSLLHDALARARQESSPQLATVIGVPGIGKTRLVWELGRALADDPRPLVWLRGRCLPYGEGVAFWALGELVKAEAGILESDRAAEIERKLAAAIERVETDAEEGRWLAGHLRVLVGLERDERPEQGGEEAFAAWRRFLELLAERGPLVLVLEDLHWADDGLLDFVDSLVDWVSGVPLLVLCTTRPELLARRPGWGGGKRNAVAISLGALSGEETGRLLALLLDQRLLPGELRAPLLQRADGNPLYAEEYVRMLVDRGTLRREGAGWRLDERIDSTLPLSLQAIVAARLDALEPADKALLQDAAVIGARFWSGALSALGGRERTEAESRLRTLERRELVHRVRASSVSGEQQYAFGHVLLRDVAYNELPRASRADKHRRAAAWIEGLGRADDHAELLAHHYEQALRFARAAGQEDAVPWLEERARHALAEAGERAASLNAFPSAARLLVAALELCPPDDPARPRLLLRLGRARFHAEEAGFEILEEACEGLLAAGDRSAAAEAEAMLYTLLSNRGEPEAAEAHIRRAAELLEGTPPSRAGTFVLVCLASFHLRADDNDVAIRVGREAVAAAEALGLEDRALIALSTLGAARIAGGDLGGIGDLERSIELAERINSPEAALGYLRLAETEAQQGRLGRRLEAHAHARRVAERFGLARHIRWLEGELVAEYYWGGHWDGALRVADDFVAESAGGTPHYLESFCRGLRGRILLARGDLSGALSDAERGLELARRARDPQLVLPAL
ncbi:MAG: AAA family ATPase, partial [Actinobacteria bacterium]|nr:AAA family ATPase [Actinomycetota bacterium]